MNTVPKTTHCGKNLANGRRRRRVPKALTAAILEQAKAGVGRVDIARTNGVSIGCVNGVLWRNGVKCGTRRRAEESQETTEARLVGYESASRSLSHRIPAKPRSAPRGSALFMNPADMRFGR